MDKVFALTLLFIFLTALIGTFIKRRSRDLCLKDFTGFHVTIAMKGGDRVWGRLLVYAEALELVYASPHEDAAGHSETSSLFFGDRIPMIQTVVRFHDELTATHQVRRRREIERTWHPNFGRRLRRRLRNFINTFRDAFNQSIGVAVAQMKRTRADSTVWQTQDTRLAQVGQTVLGSVCNAYEPALERYIGRRVVAEELVGERWVEHPGILKEYSAGWLEILDCRIRIEHQFDLVEPAQMLVNRDLDFTVTVRRAEGAPSGRAVELRIDNRGSSEVRLARVEGEGYRREIDRPIPAGGAGSIELEDVPAALMEGIAPAGHVDLHWSESDDAAAAPPLPRLRLVIEARREADLCLPRAHSAVRHGGEVLESWVKRFQQWGSY